MKIYIDMIAFYLQKAGGITSVWKELIIRFLRDNKDITLILQKDVPCENIYFEQIMEKQPCVIYESGKLLINRYFPVQCHLEKNSIFVSTYYRFHLNKSCKQYVLVHDFTYEYYVKGLKRFIHSWQKKEAIKHADVTISVSENTRKDLTALYPWSKDKQNYVIYNAANEIYKQNTEAYIAEGLLEGIKSPYLLYVGSRARYKRFDIAVKLASKCHYALLIIGGGGLSNDEKEMVSRALPYAWKQMQGLSDGQLCVLYQKAFALIYPSEYEGFGIPLIEAQGVGCPVIACDCSSISEVIADKETLMKKSTLDEAEKILRKLEKQEVREQVIASGCRNAERFSWERTYQEYVRVLEERIEK